jgi:hypothetical protein
MLRLKIKGFEHAKTLGKFNSQCVQYNTGKVTLSESSVFETLRGIVKRKMVKEGLQA